MWVSWGPEGHRAPCGGWHHSRCLPAVSLALLGQALQVRPPGPPHFQSRFVPTSGNTARGHPGFCLVGTWALGGCCPLKPGPPGQRAQEGWGPSDLFLVTSHPAAALQCYSCPEPTGVSSCVTIATCSANETVCKTTLYSLELGQWALGGQGRL